MNILKIIGFLVLISAGARAQGITPPIAEYRGDKVSGMFEIQNSTDYAMAVILGTKSFVVDENGVVRYSALDKNVRIKMGASSFVLRGHDRRMIFYKASFPAAPASFSIIATMTRAEAVEGVRVSFVFPHMIYVYQNDKLNKADIELRLAEGVLHIRNLSQKLGRVSAVQATKEDSGGFPIFPNQTRDVAAAGATRATVKFEDGFKVDVE